jgi:hypothetical protein
VAAAVVMVVVVAMWGLSGINVVGGSDMALGHNKQTESDVFLQFMILLMNVGELGQGVME